MSTQSKYKKKALQKIQQQKKTKIIVSSIVVFILALSLMFTIWSSVAGMSPVALAKSWFVTEKQDGINLFDKDSARGDELDLFELYSYDSIALDKKAEYVITTHTDKLTNFDAERAHLLIFSNTKINDLPIDFNYETMLLTRDFEVVFIEMLPTSYKFSAAAYGFDYITLLTIDDLSVEESSLKIKVEKGTYATAYSEFSKAATAAYHFTDFFAKDIAAQFPIEEPVEEPDTEEPATVEPTALVQGEQLNGIYLNTSAESEAVLKSIVADSDGETYLLLGETLDDETADVLVSLAVLNDATVLFVGNENDGFVLLWASAVVSVDESDLPIPQYSEAGWQTNASCDLLSIFDAQGHYLISFGGTGGYADWGNGDAEVGKRNLDALFSSTPWE